MRQDTYDKLMAALDKLRATEAAINHRTPAAIVALMEGMEKIMTAAIPPECEDLYSCAWAMNELAQFGAEVGGDESRAIIAEILTLSCMAWDEIEEEEEAAEAAKREEKTR